MLAGRPSPITTTVEEVYLPLGRLKVVPRSSRDSNPLILRGFQEEVVRKLPHHKLIGVEAFTGAGKTFLLLAPLLSNLLYGTRFTGAVGLYPTKPLVNDQFLSIIKTLDELGSREGVFKGLDGREAIVKYSCKLEVEDGASGVVKDGSLSIGVARTTKEVLEMLKERMGEPSKSERLRLLDLVRQEVLDVDYLIVTAVPEYPYMLLSGTYRHPHDAQRLLSLVIEGGFVYDLAKRIVNSPSEEVSHFLLKLRRRLSKLLDAKARERLRASIYSALFSDVMFLDEFHAWTFYEKPSLLALILFYYLDNEALNRDWRIIFSSATPQEKFYALLEELGIGRVEVIRAMASNTPINSHRIKSKMIIHLVPRSTKRFTGSLAWFELESTLPEVVAEVVDEICKSGRAMIFARRNSIVEECARVFYQRTGKRPVIATGVRPPEFASGKEELEFKRDCGELYVFGNYSIELGVDLKNLTYGVVYGTYLGELVQRLGRIGRGDVEEARIVIPVPSGYASELKELDGKVLTYQEFIQELSEVLAKELGIKTYGEEFIEKHRVGKLRLYVPLASYVLRQVILWEYPEEVKKVCRMFIDVIDKLDVGGIFKWLRTVQKSADVLGPLAAFRIAATVKYERDGMEDEASLSTLLGNYDVEYYKDKLIVKGVEKKSISEVLTLRAQEPNILDGFHGLVVNSKLLMRLVRGKLRGSGVLLSILRDFSIPVYVVAREEGYNYDLLNAFGYAIKIETGVHEAGTSKPLYLLLL